MFLLVAAEDGSAADLRAALEHADARSSCNTLTLLVVAAIKEARNPSGRGEEGR
jgi:hypothetical protein